MTRAACSRIVFTMRDEHGRARSRPVRLRSRDTFCFEVVEETPCRLEGHGITIVGGRRSALQVGNMMERDMVHCRKRRQRWDGYRREPQKPRLGRVTGNPETKTTFHFHSRYPNSLYNGNSLYSSDLQFRARLEGQ